jgi:phospholipase/lecithinase/hemolysin
MKKNTLKTMGHRSRALCMSFSLMLLLVVAQSTYAGDTAYSGLVVFGDSLSDPGNVYALTGQQSVAPYDEPVPTFPYAIGGNHFSNGKTYVERLARSLHLNVTAKATFNPEIVRATNYAVGAARARVGGPPRLLDLTGEVNAFLSDFGMSAPSDALYVIWIGGNDIRDALEAAFVDQTLATSFAILEAALLGEATNIGSLAAAGATDFLVLNAPNLAVAPAVTALGPQAIGAAMMFSAGYNNGLSDALDGLQLIFPNIEITRFDTFAFLTTVAANGAAFGLPQTMVPCLTFFVLEDAVCDKPKEYMFWDAVHPTTATHKLLARKVEKALIGP